MKWFIILLIVLSISFIVICIFSVLANNNLMDDEFQEFEMKHLNESKYKEDK